jgi:tRNA 2-thiouridine synthesizing protein A
MVVEADRTLDLRGLSCPMPLIKLSKFMKTLKKGTVVEMLGTDPGTKEDVPGWCARSGNELLETVDEGAVTRYFIRRG